MQINTILFTHVRKSKTPLSMNGVDGKIESNTRHGL